MRPERTPVQNIVVGSFSIDHSLKTHDQFPDHINDENLKQTDPPLTISLLAESYAKNDGGTAGNLSFNLGLLGENPIVLGSMGRESDSLQYRNKLSHLGVDISNIHISDKHTSVFLASYDPDNRLIAGFAEGAMSDSDSISLRKWKNTDTLVTISAHDPKAMLRNIRECRELGIRYMFDISQQVSNMTGESILEGVEGATIVIANEFELGEIIRRTGRSIEELNRLVPLLVTTKAEKGSTLSGLSFPVPEHIPPVEVDNIVESTGAGDAYRAGFLYGFARGWNSITCAKIGSVTSTFAITQHGGQEHTFNIDQVRTLFSESFGYELPKEA